MQDVKILTAGDSSLLLQFGNAIDPEINARIAATVQLMKEQHIEGVVDLIPAFCSLLINYDPRVISYGEMRRRMEKILSVGLPITLQDGFIQVSFIVITIIANQRGLTDAAAVGIVEKVIGFLFLIPSSMLSTVSALGAQNIGAGKPERAVATLRYAILIAGGFGLMIDVGIQFIAEPIVALFTDGTRADGVEVIRLGGQYLRGYIWDSFLAGIQFSFSGYFCAIGRSGLSFLHNFLSIVCVRVPGAYLTSRWFPRTLLPMGLASACGSLFSSIICIIAFAVLQHRSRQGGQHG